MTSPTGISSVSESRGILTWTPPTYRARARRRARRRARVWPSTARGRWLHWHVGRTVVVAHW
eukprot:5751304-Pyramimonas_sp.AAC.1